jgi:gamma-polyglutamate synthase
VSAALITGLAVLGVGAVAAGIESLANHRYRSRVPVRVHVGGARGKSSVTRLIAAGLRAGGRVTVAKTTGSLPRLILPSGAEEPWPRSGTVRIGEQQRLLRIAAELGADVLVAENMAVEREYLWAGQHRLLRAQIGVITNLRLDHVGAWGASREEVADALGVGLPRDGTLVVPAEEAHPVLLAHAQRLGTQVIRVDPSPAEAEGATLRPGEIAVNVAIARAVCALLGVEPAVALAAMRASSEDPGASSAWALPGAGGADLVFLLLFAVNDPESSDLVRAQMLSALGLADVWDAARALPLLNVRADRPDRTLQWLEALRADRTGPRRLALWGDVSGPLRRHIARRLPGFDVAEAPRDVAALPAFVPARFPGTRVVVGLGNIAGPPWRLIRYLEKGARRLDR